MLSTHRDATEIMSALGASDGAYLASALWKRARRVLRWYPLRGTARVDDGRNYRWVKSMPADTRFATEDEVAAFDAGPRRRASASSKRASVLRCRKRLAAAGMCVRCQNVSEPHSVMCRACLDKQNASSKARYRRLRAENKCPWCMAPSAEGYVYCEYHVAMKSAS